MHSTSSAESVSEKWACGSALLSWHYQVSAQSGAAECTYVMFSRPTCCICHALFVDALFQMYIKICTALNMDILFPAL